jgi:hypothetical protein
MTFLGIQDSAPSNVLVHKQQLHKPTNAKLIEKLSNLKQTLLGYLFYSCQISIQFKVIVFTSRSNYQHSKFKSNGSTNDYNP